MQQQQGNMGNQQWLSNQQQGLTAQQGMIGQQANIAGGFRAGGLDQAGQDMGAAAAMRQWGAQGAADIGQWNANQYADMGMQQQDQMAGMRDAGLRDQMNIGMSGIANQDAYLRNQLGTRTAQQNRQFENMNQMNMARIQGETGMDQAALQALYNATAMQPDVNQQAHGYEMQAFNDLTTARPPTPSIFSQWGADFAGLSQNRNAYEAQQAAAGGGGAGVARRGRGRRSAGWRVRELAP